MLSIKQGLALLSTAAAVGLPMALRAPSPGDTAISDGVTYTEQQKEFYLTDEEKHYIRPGLNIAVDDLSVNSANKVVVDLRFFDDLNQPLDRAGQVTPGPISASFILAWYDGEAGYYTAYTTRTQTSPITGVAAVQAGTDSGGQWQDIALGQARYTFGRALPAGFDATKTHSVAIYATRDVREMIDKRYYFNLVHDFRPDGAAVTEVWDKISDDTCNSCHHDLGLHGGSRKDVKLCVTCHSPQTVDPDTGNTVDMKVMIHKIHMGADLPSVQAGGSYTIVGNQQSVHDYSHIVLPRPISECTNCHRPDTSQASVWMTEPSRAACGSCHDDIVWETGEGHPIPQLDDAMCGYCHQPEGDREFDASVKGAHVVPTQSSQLPGLNVEILSVDGALPGGHPTVSFAITTDDGAPVDIATMDRVGFIVGGPSSDFSAYIRENAIGATADGGAYTWTFVTPIPEDATGTWLFTVDARRNVAIQAGSETMTVREAAYNPLFYVAVDGGAPVERRMVVDVDRCNVCHGDLAFHGGQRKNPIECATCHNALETDEGDRPADELPAESIQFKWMIHKIHAGVNLEHGYTIGGSEGADFSDIGYPGVLNNCAACHLDGSYGVPVVEGALDMVSTNVGFYFPVKPAAAACLACHDSVDAAAHAYTNTAPFGEGCAACHGDGRDYAVEEVHAQ